MSPAPASPPGGHGTAALDESAEDLYENAPCGYLSTRLDGTVARVNQTFLAWTGYTRDELVGRRRFQDLLTPGGRIYHETHYAPLLRMQDAVREIALEIVRADGERLPVLVNAAVRHDAEGRPALVRTTVFDATDRRRYEQELLRARERERDARRRVERLQRITARLAATLTPAAVAAAAVDELSDDGLADCAAILPVDADARTLAVAAARGFDAARLAAAGAPAGVARRALEGGRPVYAERDGGVEAAIPLAVDSRVIGLLALGWDRRSALDEDERALFEAFAGQCAGALERARLHDRLERDAERWARLAATSRALDAASGVADRVRTLVDVLVPELADWALVELAGPGGLSVASGTEPAGGAPAGRRIDMPLRAGGARLGMVSLARAPGRPAFDATEAALVAELVDRAGLAVEIAGLLEQSRSIAETLQVSLLAGDPPRDPRVAVATRLLPAVAGLEVGGDWHDAFPLASDRLGIAVGDVVGRGIDAATAMGQLRSAVRALAVADLSPAGVLERLDRFVDHVPAACFATLAYGDLDLAGGRLRFACAGHPPPVAVAPDRAPRLLWGGRSAPLGAYVGAVSRAEDELDLTPGTRLLLYTDGLVERRGEPLDDGLARLVQEVARHADAPVDALVGAVTDALLAGRRSADDVCLLCVELRRV